MSGEQTSLLPQVDVAVETGYPATESWVGQPLVTVACASRSESWLREKSLTPHSPETLFINLFYVFDLLNLLASQCIPHSHSAFPIPSRRPFVSCHSLKSVGRQFKATRGVSMNG